MEVCQCACLQKDPWAEIFWGKFQTKTFWDSQYQTQCSRYYLASRKEKKNNTWGCFWGTCLIQKTGYQGDVYGRNVAEDVYKTTENFRGLSIDTSLLNEKYKIVQNFISWKSSFKYKTMRKQDAFSYKILSRLEIWPLGQTSVKGAHQEWNEVLGRSPNDQKGMVWEKKVFLTFLSIQAWEQEWEMHNSVIFLNFQRHVLFCANLNHCRQSAITTSERVVQDCFCFILD